MLRILVDRVHISEDVLSDIRLEARSAYPNETGGVLLGFIADHVAYVRRAIGPGPGAEHAAHTFSPDQSWQLQQIEEWYDSNPREAWYLGDWHTHPDGVARPSWRDWFVARRIAKHRDALNRHPLMAILAIDEEDAGSLSVFQFHALRLRRCPIAGE